MLVSAVGRETVVGVVSKLHDFPLLFVLAQLPNGVDDGEYKVQSILFCHSRFDVSLSSIKYVLTDVSQALYPTEYGSEWGKALRSQLGVEIGGSNWIESRSLFHGLYVTGIYQDIRQVMKTVADIFSMFTGTKTNVKNVKEMDPNSREPYYQAMRLYLDAAALDLDIFLKMTYDKLGERQDFHVVWQDNFMKYRKVSNEHDAAAEMRKSINVAMRTDLMAHTEKCITFLEGLFDTEDTARANIADVANELWKTTNLTTENTYANPLRRGEFLQPFILEGSKLTL